MSGEKTCSSCVYCVTEEGPPFFCALRDLYYFVLPKDKACGEFIEYTGENKAADGGEQEATEWRRSLNTQTF